MLVGFGQKLPLPEINIKRSNARNEPPRNRKTKPVNMPLNASHIDLSEENL